MDRILRDEDIRKYLTQVEREILEELLNEIEEGRRLDGYEVA